jgi:hypothetical protein
MPWYTLEYPHTDGVLHEGASGWSEVPLAPGQPVRRTGGQWPEQDGARVASQSSPLGPSSRELEQDWQIEAVS